MRTVHVYLCVLDTDDAVNTVVIRDIDDVIRRGKASAMAGHAVLVHVGLARPDDDSLRSHLRSWRGSVLLTASARWALGGDVASHVCEVSSIQLRGNPDPLPIHLALSGWGYQREAPAGMRPLEHGRPKDAVGGASGFMSSESELQFWSELRDLPPAKREELTAHRERSIRHNCSSWSVQLMAMKGPEWFRDRPVAEVPLRVRTRNCLQSQRDSSPRTIGDLDQWPDSRLLRIRSFGRTSLRDLHTALVETLVQGPCAGGTPTDHSDSLRLNISERWCRCRRMIHACVPDVRVSELRLSARSRRVLEEHAIDTLGVLETYDDQDLLALDTFGLRSLRDVVEAVESLHAFETWVDSDPRAAEQSGVVSHESGRAALPPDMTLRRSLSRTLQRLTPNQRAIIEGRLGAAGQPVTLRALGDTVGLTRERVRQIELHQIRTIIDEEVWDDEMRARLDAALSRRDSPLSLRLLVAMDGWFDGFEDHLDFLSGVIHAFGDDQYHCWDLDGVGRIVSRIDGEQWTQMSGRLSSVLEQVADRELRVSDVREYASMIASSDNAPELASTLAEWFLSEAVLSGEDDRQDARVISQSGSIADLCISVLRQSEVPMHYTEVHRMMEAHRAQPVDVRRVHGVLSRGALLYGRGCFGLMKHLGLDDTIRIELANAVQEVLDGGSSGRQWHCEELLDILSEEGVKLPTEMTPYKLSILLHGVSGLEYLGRLVWMRTDIAESSAGRRHVADLVEDAIRDAGQPLSAEEIWEAVAEHRGTSGYRLVPETSRVIRVSRGVFGLLDRDLGLSTSNLEEWQECVSKAISCAESLDIDDIKALQGSCASDLLRESDARLLGRVAAKMIGLRLTRGGQLIRSPVSLEAGAQ